MKIHEENKNTDDKIQLLLEIDEQKKLEVDFNIYEDLNKIINEATKNINLPQDKKEKLKEKIQKSLENYKVEKLNKIRRNKEIKNNNINRLFYQSLAHEKRKEELLGNVRSEKELLEDKQCTFNPVLVYSSDLSTKKILFEKNNSKGNINIIYHSNDDDVDVSRINKLSRSYSKEKQQFLRIAKILINREINKPRIFNNSKNKPVKSTYRDKIKSVKKDFLSKKEYELKINNLKEQERRERQEQESKTKKDNEVEEDHLNNNIHILNEEDNNNNIKEIENEKTENNRYLTTTKETRENTSFNNLKTEESEKNEKVESGKGKKTKNKPDSLTKIKLHPYLKRKLGKSLHKDNKDKHDGKNIDITSKTNHNPKKFHLLSYREHLKKVKESNNANNTNLTNLHLPISEFNKHKESKDKFFDRLSYSSHLKNQTSRSNILNRSMDRNKFSKSFNKNSRSLNINFSNSKLYNGNIPLSCKERKKTFDYNYIKSRKNLRYLKQEYDLLNSYESFNSRKDDIKEINSLRYNHNLDKFKLNNLKEIFEILHKNKVSSEDLDNVEKYGISHHFKENLIIPVFKKIKEEHLEFNFQNFYLIANELMNKI